MAGSAGAGPSGVSTEPPGGVAAVGAPTDGGARRRLALAVRERLPLWVRLRCGLEPRALAALAVVLAVAAILAAQHFWFGRPQAVSAPELVRQDMGAPQSPRPSLQGASQPGAGPGARIVVDVGGKVRRPGVLRLPAGSRVADALNAAGGVRAGADTTGLNRARVLVDGEQVLVGVVHPDGAPVVGTGATDPARPGAGGPVGAGARGAPDGPGSLGPLSLNTATAEQLDSLPGVGPVLARHIIDHRDRHGGFRSVDELREVNGIGDRRFADLRTLVRP